MNRQRAWLVATVGLALLGAALTVLDLARWASQPTYALLTGPLQVGDQKVALRASADGAVDVTLGDSVIATNVTRTLANAVNDAPYQQRFAHTIMVVTPAGQRVPVALAIAPLDADGLPRLVPLATDRAIQLPVRPSPLPVPGPTLMLLSLCLGAGSRRRDMTAAPTIILAAGLAMLGSVAGWPLVLRAPLPLLPPVTLALLLVLGVAALFGARAQRFARSSSRAGRWFRGAAVGLGLLGVFIAAYVNLRGFITPIFRPPDATLTPGEWLHNDFVLPSVALLASGLLPAVLGGALYGARLDRRDAT